MSVAIAFHPQRMAQPQDHHFSLNANSAGAPLPLIPRRTSSTPSRPPITSSVSLPRLPYSDSSSGSNLSSVSRTTSPRDDSDSSSSGSNLSDGMRPTVRTKRTRGVRTLCPPELPTSIPTIKNAFIAQKTDRNIINDDARPALSRPMIYTPGMSLRLALENPKQRNASDSHDSQPAETSAQGAKSAFYEFPTEGRLVRKKSGQLVKSSLKTSKSATRNTLSIFTVPQSSKSEPTTPTNKAVHFDAQLEHVKLFLAEQKPLAVSRDGSPTDDTSGTDSDFPKFIYGEDDRRSRKKLVMQLSNMPSVINPNSDVALEDLCLTLDGTSILGRVRVRNIAFSKWVAIRFTFDSWQTTSEVTGRYVESIDTEFDRFSFTIRLNDLLARIEGKTLVMAIRYSVAGRDIWDNNNGQNYLVTFTKSKGEETPTLSDEEAPSDMADLRSKLEKVSQSDDRTGPAFLAQHSRRQSAPTDPDTTCFRTSGSFASRYDFAASLKSNWDPSKSPPSHTRNQSFPLTGSRTSPGSIPWPQRGSTDVHSPIRSPVPSKPNMGSPRDTGDQTFMPFNHSQQMEVENGIHVQPYTPRNHRRGYFDLTRTKSPHPPPATLRRTPPGTPSSVQKLSSGNAVFSPPLRYSSFSPIDNSSRSMPQFNGDGLNFIGGLGGDSELSTPSLFTPSSSRSSTPSPTEMFMSPLACDENTESLSPDTHYRQFINKFCFFTGQGSYVDESTVDLLPRAHSASDIEEFLSGVSPRLPFTTTLGLSPNDIAPITISTSPSISTSISPTRSSSLDDLMLNRSGSLTPTVSRLALMSASASIAISTSVSAQIRNMTPVVS